MRVLSFSLVATLLALSFGTCVSAQASIPNTFPVNLSLGSSGTQVRILQQILNRDPDTRIASTGPGSSGNETSYFGSLTKAAVVQFQEKYANEILAPAGLTQGNGFVGIYTRIELNTLSAVAVNNVSTSNPATMPQNPNLENLSALLTTLDRVATKQGLSSTTIKTLEERVIARLATTTNLRVAFLNIAQGTSHQSLRDTSFFGSVLATVERAFTVVFMPKHALAQETTIPFGGALLDAFPCDGGIWNLTLEPLPPSYVALLSYEEESQIFESYNIPDTDWLLGEYEPGADGACWVGDIPYPSEGMISPEVGSSPTIVPEE